MVRDLAINSGFFIVWLRVLKSSILFSFKTKLINSSFIPFSFKKPLCSEVNFGRFFFVSLIKSLEIFSKGISVSGYILAAVGIGRRNSVFPDGRALLTSLSQIFSSKQLCCLLISSLIVLIIIFGS